MALARVKKLPIPARISPVVKSEDESDRLSQRIVALEAELHQREATISRLHGEVEDALTRGKEEGRKEGLAAADDRQNERLRVLENGLERAQDEFAASLASLERLAALLARDCLDIMFGDSEYREEMLGGLIAAQMAKIEKSALLAVVLSQQDFADKSALTKFAKRTGVAAMRFSLDADLPSGACLMRLKLGNHEIGIGQQWGVLRDHLNELSLPEDVA